MNSSVTQDLVNGPRGIGQPLGTAAAIGTVITFAAAIASKSLSTIAQLVLAWYLAPADFGVAATASAILGIASLLQAGGVHVMLVGRRRQFLRIGSQAFYLSITLHTIVALALLALSPALSGYYGDQRIGHAVSLFAMILPLQQFGLLQSAWLVRRLRFGTISVTNLVQGVVLYGGQIALSILGLGVYALIIPHIPAVIIRVWLVRVFARRMPLAFPDPRCWYRLWRDAMLLNLSAFFTSLGQSGFVLVLGLIVSTHLLGLYNWGFTLSSQAVLLLSGSLTGVLLPVYARLDREPQRQLKALVSSMRILCAIIAPCCVVQALVARDLLSTFFAERWWPAWPVVTFISLGLILYPHVIASQSLLMAQGRYLALVLSNAVSALLSASSALVSFTGRIEWIAIAHATTLLLSALGLTWVAIRPLADDYAPLVAAALRQIVPLITATLVAAAVRHSLIHYSSLLRLIATSAVFMSTYAVALRISSPALVKDCADRVRSIIAPQSLSDIL